MTGSAEGQSRYYEAALWALRFVESRRATKRRFGPEADATWAAFRGDFGISARIDLLLRDADAQWPGAFGARSVYDLAAVAQGIEFAISALPDTDPYHLWALVDLMDPSTGRLLEIDLLVLLALQPDGLVGVVRRDNFASAIARYAFPGASPSHQGKRIDTPTQRAVVQALQQIGVRQRKGKYFVGPYELGEMIRHSSRGGTRCR